MPRHPQQWFIHLVGLLVGALATSGCSSRDSDDSAGALLPVTPGNVTSIADTSLQIEWVYDGAAAAAFRVERQESTGTFGVLGTVGPDVRRYRDSRILGDGLSYVYRIGTVGSSGEIVYSREITFIASLAPATGLVVTRLTGTAATLRWEDNSNIEAVFQIEAGQDSSRLSLLGEAGPDVVALTVPGSFAPTTRYWFRVRPVAIHSRGIPTRPVPSQVGMVLLEGGTFVMGSSSGEGDEAPEHAVTLGSYLIDTGEVTVLQYRTFCIATGRSFPSTPAWGFRDSDPVVYVSWQDATAYAQWMGKRLPTEAEWELAARGGVSGSANNFTYSGSNNIDLVGWYSGNAGGQVHPSGTMASNVLGIYNMTGNVQEWCADWYDPTFYSRSPLANPQGPDSGTYRVLRGGSWNNGPYYCRVTSRNRELPTSVTLGTAGFRCAVTY